MQVQVQVPVSVEAMQRHATAMRADAQTAFMHRNGYFSLVDTSVRGSSLVRVVVPTVPTPMAVLVSVVSVLVLVSALVQGAGAGAGQCWRQC